MNAKKKLIEVALPLEAINAASAREKSIRHGHPSTLHLWWARRPLAACRAVLFASIVDDPSSDPERFPDEAAQEQERQRLFRLIERMVPWENANDPHVLQDVRDELFAATGGDLPPVLDPFCGGGSIPLEAQRLGLEAHGSDLNPVAVLITKALIEIPPRFAGCSPVNPNERGDEKAHSWSGARGLAADVRFYGAWMRERAQERIGHLYPKATLANGQEATVIAWLWARTVACSNPACGARMPLVRSWALSTKSGKASWVEPVVEREAGASTPRVRFEVKKGASVPKDKLAGTKTGHGASFDCLCCGTHIKGDHIKGEAMAGRMWSQLMAVVAKGNRERIYLAPTEEQEKAAEIEDPQWKPTAKLSDDRRAFFTPLYGLSTFDTLFTTRQLTTLTTFSDLVDEVRQQVLVDALESEMSADITPLQSGGQGAAAYADAVATYLAFAVDKVADLGNSLNRWEPVAQCPRQLFSRQAIPMVWDFAEANIFSDSSGAWSVLMDNLVRSFNAPLFAHDRPQQGQAIQQDATQLALGYAPLISTDPPYYDNVPYADLSDFFYVWLRHSLASTYGELLKTVLTPKEAQLVADVYRHGGREQARKYFERGFIQAFKRMREVAHPDYPLTVYYSFKQAENEDEVTGQASTGWETMLEGMMQAGYQVTGTWPVRTEASNRMRALDSNALASSIVLVCRSRAKDAKSATRTQFLRELRRELPDALRAMQHGNIAPVDFAHAAIRPGMGIFSRYSQVLENDGTRLGVRAALALINTTLDEVLAEQEGHLDSDSRWAVAWFTQHAFESGLYGSAETLCTAKDTSMRGLMDAGIVEAKSGRVRLLPRAELPADWKPAEDARLSVWEATQHLVHAHQVLGDDGAAAIVRGLQQSGKGDIAEQARDLAYQLFALCERKKWAGEALGYNALVIAWPDILRRVQEVPSEPFQTSLDI